MPFRPARPRRPQFTLTAAHVQKPLDSLTVREIKGVLMEQCMHRFVQSGDGASGGAAGDGPPISLHMGSRALEDDMTLWQYHLEFGERVVVGVSPSRMSSYARLTLEGAGQEEVSA